MFSSLNNLLNWGDGFTPSGKLMSIIDTLQSDANFLLFHFISMYLKQGNQVLLVGFEQSLFHYFNVARKLGINLTQENKTGRFSFVNALSIPYPWAESGEGDSIEGFKAFPCSFFTTSNDAECLKKLYLLIEREIQKFTTKNEGLKGVVIIDSLSILHNSTSSTSILDLLHYLCNITRERPNFGVVVLTHGDSEEDNLLVQGICHQSDITFLVAGLQSGHSRDIHGQMEILGVPFSPPLLHYKVTENNAQFFLPGTKG
eukprot:TRINITY_DN868_c0_g1_i1.p1 TRINITY_DN868_c0_g1~~TRINITY_DN868_c0_g1_i1.p1  ORF type:complete len:258 (-),score=50.52 TRINITY_DN868_c0_g1_i1:192-965(-)